MSGNNIKNKAIAGAAWKFGERTLAQAIGFVVSIILARKLLPEEYGLIALVFVFTTICDKMLVAGFPTSLIQKKNADDKDFSTVLYFSFAAALILYIILFFCAPFIANFYSKFDSKQLIAVIRILGLSLFLVAFNSVQHAYVSKHMLFKRYFWSTLGGTSVSGLVGITMAYNGWGVWALVAQNMTMAFVDGLILFITVRWRPKLLFSLERLKGLFKYGWKIFTASIIKTIYNDLRGLVIGKIYTPADLAFYNRGQTLPQLVDTNIAGTIDSVLFPAYSSLQENKTAMLAAMRRAVKTSCFILMPALALLAAVSSPLVELLLTHKWQPCVPYMQILSFSFMFAPVELENLQSIKAIGRSDIVLKLEIAKRGIGLLLLIIAVFISMKAIAYSMLIGNIIAAVLNAVPNQKLNGYSIHNQFMDILPSLLMSMSIFVCSLLIVDCLQETNEWVQLIAGSMSGIILYVGASVMFKVESFYYLLNIVRRKH